MYSVHMHAADAVSSPDILLYEHGMPHKPRVSSCQYPEVPPYAPSTAMNLSRPETARGLACSCRPATAEEGLTPPWQEASGRASASGAPARASASSRIRYASTQAGAAAAGEPDSACCRRCARHSTMLPFGYAAAPACAPPNNTRLVAVACCTCGLGCARCKSGHDCDMPLSLHAVREGHLLQSETADCQTSGRPTAPEAPAMAAL